jgi:hypothetical protein
MIEFLILSTIVLLYVVIKAAREEMRKIEESSQISEDWEHFIKTGDDRKWRKRK